MHAAVFVRDNLVYETISSNPSEYKVTTYSSTSNVEKYWGDIIIPDSVNYRGNNYAVVEIGKNTCYTLICKQYAPGMVIF